MTLSDQLAEADTPQRLAVLIAAHRPEFDRALRLLEAEPDLREACRHTGADADLSGRLCDVLWMIDGATRR